MLKEKPFTYITEFSGCGGASLGLQQAGGKGLLAIEYDPCDKSQNAYQHLITNFPELYKKGAILNKDITTVSGNQILKITNLEKGELDILQSSAPCQGFSSSNTNRNADDSRNDLFFVSINHVRALKPKIAIFENVAGMTRGAMKTKYLQITSALKSLGYNVKTWILNASDYGIPRTRPRTWIIGVRKDLGAEPSVPDFYETVVGLSDVLPYLEGHRQGQFNRQVIPGNCPVSTITKTSGFKVIENGLERLPEIEELRVLCTFPQNYKFVGSREKVHQRLGNSVLPKQMEILATHLYETVISPSHVETFPHTDLKVA